MKFRNGIPNTECQLGGFLSTTLGAASIFTLAVIAIDIGKTDYFIFIIRTFKVESVEVILLISPQYTRFCKKYLHFIFAGPYNPMAGYHWLIRCPYRYGLHDTDLK